MTQRPAWPAASGGSGASPPTRADAEHEGDRGAALSSESAAATAANDAIVSGFTAVIARKRA